MQTGFYFALRHRYQLKFSLHSIYDFFACTYQRIKREVFNCKKVELFFFLLVTLPVK